jgi:hypothetical protein
MRKAAQNGRICGKITNEAKRAQQELLNVFIVFRFLGEFLRIGGRKVGGNRANGSTKKRGFSVGFLPDLTQAKGVGCAAGGRHFGEFAEC